MLPEKDSLHSVDISKNDLMENDYNLEEDTRNLDLVAAPINMEVSVDTSTVIHSEENLCQSQRKKLRKTLHTQSVHVLEHYHPEDRVLLGDISLTKCTFPEKHSSFKPPSVDICPKNELVVKQSNGDASLFNGHGTLENDNDINLQMEHGKIFEKADMKKMDFAATIEMNTSVDTSTMVHSAQDLSRSHIKDLRKKLCKQDVHVLEHDASNDHVLPRDNSIRSVLPEGQLEQKERDQVDNMQITLEVVSYGDGVSPKVDNILGRDRSCELPKEQHVEVQSTRAETFSPPHLGVIKSDVLQDAGKKENCLQTLQSQPERVCIGHSKKKLLVLDVNGLLVDVVRSPCPTYEPNKMVSSKAVFKRAYCEEFLEFCFERFNVGVWSSRVEKNLNEIIDFLLGDSRKKLLFCWHASQCSKTGLNTMENENKPLVLKELKKLWEKLEPNLPWEKGEYNETNTLLLDDSPYKALCNPAYTAIFPYPYDYRTVNDSSLGPVGDLRVYLEGLASAENVQEYVRENPFGQQAITERDASWGFYSQVFQIKPCPPPYVGGDSKVTNAKLCESHGDGDCKVTNAKSCKPCDDGNTSSPAQQP